MISLIRSLFTFLFLAGNFCAGAQTYGWQWANSGINPGNSAGNSVATDGAGNVYVCGTFVNTIAFDTATLTSKGAEDVFLVKYTSNGSLIWARDIGGPGSDIGCGVATDIAGNAYITGYYRDTLSAQGIKIGTIANSVDVFVIKCDNNGTVAWAKSAGGDRPDYGYGIAVDNASNVYITGYYGNDGASPPSHWSAKFDTVTITSTGGSDVFFAKYTSGGQVIWAKSAGGVYADYGRSIKVDSFSNVYIYGFFTAPWIRFDTTRLYSTHTGSMTGDIYVAKFDSTGSFTWARAISGSQTSAGFGSGTISTAQSFGVDPTGYSFVCGHFFNCSVKAGSLNITGHLADDIFIASYDPSGNAVWGKSAGGTNSERANGLAIDRYSNVYITGSFTSFDCAFDSDTLFPDGGSDVYVAKYNKNGIAQWAVKGGGTGSESGSSLATDAAGGVYVTGSFTSNPGVFGSHLITNGGGFNVFTSKLSATTGIPTLFNKETTAIVYPNPSTGIFTVKTKEKLTRIDVTDQLGKVVFTQTVLPMQKEYSVNISYLPDGLYYLRCIGTNVGTTHKVSIRRL